MTKDPRLTISSLLSRPPQPPPKPKPKHYALLITFGPASSPICTSIEAFAKALYQNLGWSVHRMVLPSNDPQKVFENNVRRLAHFSKNEEDRLVVFYCGFSIKEGEELGFAGWEWYAQTPDFTCLEHTPRVNPHPTLLNLCKNTNRDILFIFHTAFTPELCPLPSPQTRPNRKITLWNLSAPFSFLFECEEGTACAWDEDECLNRMLVAEPKGFSLRPIKWLTEVLVHGLVQGEEQEVEDLRTTDVEERAPKNEVLQIMGDGFVLGRG